MVDTCSESCVYRLGLMRFLGEALSGSAFWLSRSLPVLCHQSYVHLLWHVLAFAVSYSIVALPLVIELNILFPWHLSLVPIVSHASVVIHVLFNILFFVSLFYSSAPLFIMIPLLCLLLDGCNVLFFLFPVHLQL